MDFVVDIPVEIDYRMSPNRGTPTRTLRTLRSYVRDTCQMAARKAKNDQQHWNHDDGVVVPGPVHVHWIVYWGPGRNEWDEDNLRAVAGKGLQDGLVQEGIIEDDRPSIMTSRWEQKLYGKDHHEQPHIVARITPQPPETSSGRRTKNRH